LLRAGNVHEGALHAEAAVALDPGNAVSRNLLGVARAMEGRLEDAVAHFRESIAIDPQYAEARANLTRAEYELGTRPERRTGVPES
jgi:Flp pilus assembly protein TadD